MRVVIDTGVFTSAAIKAQTVPGIAVYRAAQRGLLLKSRSTEAELVEVIDRPRLARLIAPAARARLVELMSLAELVTITERIAECCDPKDDKFLELAVNGKTDVIVSGDADLLVLNPFRGVSVCKRGYFDETARRVDYMLNALGPNGYLQRMCALQAKSSKLSWSGQGRNLGSARLLLYESFQYAAYSIYHLLIAKRSGATFAISMVIANYLVRLQRPLHLRRFIQDYGRCRRNVLALVYEVPHKVLWFACGR